MMLYLVLIWFLEIKKETQDVLDAYYWNILSVLYPLYHVASLVSYTFQYNASKKETKYC